MGRSIKDIVPKTEYENLWQDTEQVLHTLQVKEMELKSLMGEISRARILPYRTRENVIDGVVLTFIDISAQHLLAMAKNFAESIVNTVREPLLVLNDDLKVISANQAFYQAFQTSKTETENRLIYELGDGQWDIPKLRELLEEIIPENAVFTDFEVEHDFPRIGHKIMLLNARRIPAAGEHPSMILLAIEDVTERQKKERELPGDHWPAGEGVGGRRGGEGGYRRRSGRLCDEGACLSRSLGTRRTESPVLGQWM